MGLPFVHHPLARSSVRWGMVSAVGMVAFYAAVVTGASGSVGHLVDQVGTDWYLLVPIVAGFGVQVGLVVELRRRRRLLRDAAVAGAAGAGGSVVGMMACCAHHLAELAPLVAVTGAATFLVSYRVGFMAAGLVATAIGIAVAARRLRHLPDTVEERGLACTVH